MKPKTHPVDPAIDTTQDEAITLLIKAMVGHPLLKGGHPVVHLYSGHVRHHLECAFRLGWNARKAHDALRRSAHAEDRRIQAASCIRS